MPPGNGGENQQLNNMENTQNILDYYFENARSQECDMPLEDVDTLISQHTAEHGSAKRFAKQTALLPVKFIVLIVVGIAIVIGGAVGILLTTGTSAYTGGALVLHHRQAGDTLGDTAAVQAWVHAGNAAAAAGGSGTDKQLSGSQPVASPADSLAAGDGGNSSDEPAVHAMPWTQPVAPRTQTAAATGADPAADADAVVYKEFNASGKNVISFKSAAGRVAVTGNGGDKLTVAVHLWKQGRLIAAGDPLFARYAEGFAISIGQDTGTVAVSARKIASSRMWRGVTLSFTICAPYETDCFINNSESKIDITAASSGKKNITADGGVNLRDLLGLTDTLASGGGIAVNNIRGNLIALSVAGSIDVNGIGGSVDACSIGGSIRLSGIRGATDAISMHGSISAVNLIGPAELETIKGDIRASISRTRGASIKMDGGTVSLPREHFVGSVTDDSAQGDILGGGPMVQMSTSGGKMVLEQE